MKKLYRFFLLAVLSALLGLTALAAQQETEDMYLSAKNIKME